ncbi:MAG: ABC transporter ATP-binding protein [Deltaproteobacteria bacterium]|nr:ABC transporter ATP-binding protein [Deltaproteobacteria bacterium]
MREPAFIQARGVRKRYRGASRDAVRGLCLDIGRGTVFGLLGPNGAGKTTTLLLLCGLLRPDAGTVAVAGARDPLRARRRIGLVPQNPALYGRLTARENMQLFGSLHGLGGGRLRARCQELLRRIDLGERADDRVETYSAGMVRRLNLVAGLVHEPDILLLDEPTVGIDPQSRARLFDIVHEERRRGVTALYTTHHLEEASQLCDRVAIMDQGELLVEDTPAGLVAAQGRYRIELQVDRFPQPFAQAIATLDPTAVISERDGLLVASTSDQGGAMQLLEGVRAAAQSHGVAVSLRRVDEPSLEGVFLALTGRSMRDVAE